MIVNLSSPPTFTRCKCGKDLLSSAEVKRSNSWIHSTFKAVKYSQAHSSSQGMSKSSLELLPKELLYPILDHVYDESRESLRLCCCSRPDTPYETIRKISLAHRIVDTETLRITCSTFHAWARYRITHAYGNERIELDVSDVTELAVRLERPGRTVLRRLRKDFPLLIAVILYLGNPGQISNVRGVVTLLQEEHSKSKARRIIKGVSFWDSQVSYKAPRKKLLMHIINATILKQPSFTTTEDRAAMFKQRIMQVLESIWLGERNDELAIYTELYRLLAENISGSVYTQIPIYILRARDCGILTKIIHSILDACHHTVFRDFRGSDTAHMVDYMHELYDLVELTDPSYWEDLVGLIGLTPKRMKRRILRDEDINFQSNIEKLGKLVRPAAANVQKVEIRLRRRRLDEVPPILPRLNTKILGITACLPSCRLSSVEVTGGAANEVTLFGLLTVLSSSWSTLKSLIFLPSLSLRKDNGIPHHCPLFGHFEILVNVHIKDNFCPVALEASQKAFLGKSRHRKWRVEWVCQWPYSLNPCFLWKQKLARGKGANLTDHPCTALSSFLDDCRAAADTLSHAQDSTVWILELVMLLTRYNLRYIPSRTLSYIPLSSVITWADHFAAETKKYQATFWPLESGHIANVELHSYCREGVKEYEEVLLRQWRSGIAWGISGRLHTVTMHAQHGGWDVGL